jgi:hypothetical protein
LADNKASAIIALSTFNATMAAILPEAISLWQKILLGLSSIGIAIGLLLAIGVIAPRVNGRSKEGLIFWGNILSHEHYPEYQNAFMAASSIDDVLKHNYYLADVANRKYICLRKAINAQYVVLPGFWLSIILTRLL